MLSWRYWSKRVQSEWDCSSLLLALWIHTLGRFGRIDRCRCGCDKAGLLLLATIGAYLPNAMFHDTNIIDGVNLLVFFLAGIVSGLAAMYGRRPLVSHRESAREVRAEEYEAIVSC